MKTSALQRFLKYVTYDTRSDEGSSTFPSTPGQLVLLRELVAELRALGLDDVAMDEYGYVMATVAATAGREQSPVIGFIAHVDTSPEMPGHDVRPIVHERYDGRDLGPARRSIRGAASLGRSRRWPCRSGNSIVTASGRTLLGSDDKAGVAEIRRGGRISRAHSEIPHGPVRIAFTPDEEIGRGANHFDVNALRRRLRVHARWWRPWRARIRKLLRRRNHGHVQRIQHAPRVREGTHGELDPRGCRFRRAPSREEHESGDDRRVRGLPASVSSACGGRLHERQSPRPRLRDRKAEGERGARPELARESRAGASGIVGGVRDRRVLPEHARSARAAPERGGITRARRSGSPAWNRWKGRFGAAPMAPDYPSWVCRRQTCSPANTTSTRRLEWTSAEDMDKAVEVIVRLCEVWASEPLNP